MRKVLFLVLVVFSLAACSSGNKSKKIKDFESMDTEQLTELLKNLTSEEAEKLGLALAECQTDTKAKVCNKTIKQVIK